MARVVQRQKGIPWALIAFVFLFLVAATLAVLWRIDLDEKIVENQKVSRDKELYGRMSPRPAKEPELTVWKKQEADLALLVAEASKPNGRGVIQQMQDRELMLVDVVAGLSSGLSLEQATVKAREARDAISKDPAVGLMKIIETLQTEAAASRDKIASLEQAGEAARREVEGLQKQMTSLKAAHDTETKDLDAKLTTATKEKGEIDKNQQTELAKIKKQADDRIEQLNVEINRNQGEIDRLKRDLRASENKAVILTKKLDVYIHPKKMRTATFQANGKVMQIKPEENIVYINIGEKDRVVPGLTFAVYGGLRGMPQITKEDGTMAEAAKLKGKAQLSVVQAFEKVSLCRVEWQADPGDPIVTGDLVANLAFDTMRTYRFVVIGDFDIYSSGRPQEADADHIKFLVRRFRGEVTKDLDDQTDYLIVGTKPVETMPIEGAEESPQMVKARQEKEKRRAEYERIRKLADARDIRVLNANEFLALVGYTPQNTLRTFGPGSN